MKKIVLSFVILLTLLGGGIYFIALPKAKETIQTNLKNLGFKTPTIDGITLSLTGLNVKSIQLDQDGFNNITNLKATLFWPTYFFKSTINSIDVEEIKFSQLSEEIKSISSLTRILQLKKINTLPIETIKVQKITYDISSAQGAIRIEGNASLQTQDQQKKLLATITANQNQLNFNSQWSSKISDQETQLDISFNEFNINYGAFNLKRGVGWLSYQEDTQTNNLLGQLDSSSGTFMNLPFQNISLILGKNENHYPLLLRASASGVDGVALTTDLHMSQDKTKQALKATLDIDNTSSFLSYLQNNNIISEVPTKTLPQKTNINIELLPEKRFADGPAPFGLSITQDLKESLSGTFLIYPNSFDIRGTAEGNEEFISLLKSITAFDDDKFSDDTVRIDGNLKSLITTK